MAQPGDGPAENLANFLKLSEQLSQLKGKVAANTQGILRSDSAMQPPDGANMAVTVEELAKEIKRINEVAEQNRQAIYSREQARDSEGLREIQRLFDGEIVALKKQVEENSRRSARNSLILNQNHLSNLGEQQTTVAAIELLYPPTKASEEYGNLNGDEIALVHAVVQGSLGHLIPTHLRSRVEAMFRALDVDRSMTLTEEDFRCLQDSQKDLVLRSAFHDMRNIMDQDNDGMISEAEFFAYFVVAALFGGFQFIGGMPTSPLSLDSKRNIGEQMIQVHLNFYSHFESHVSKFEVILKQQGLIH